MRKHHRINSLNRRMNAAFGQFMLMNRLAEIDTEPSEPASFTDEFNGCGYSRQRKLLMGSTALLPFVQMDLIACTSAEATVKEMMIYRDHRRAKAVERQKKDRARKRLTMKPDEKHHPAIVLFRELTHRYPTRELVPGVIDALGERPDRKWLTTCYHEWLKRGYRPLNLAWLFEWYAQGKIPSGPVRRRDVGASQTQAAPVAVAPPENQTMPLSEILRIVEEHESKISNPEPEPFENEDITTDEVLRIVEEHERTK